MKFYYESERVVDYIGADEPLEYPAHFHKNIELVYMEEGEARAFSGGMVCELKKGDFFIAFPEMVHYYDNCKKVKAVVIIISATRMPEYSEILFKKHPVSPLIRNSRPEARTLVEIIAKNKNSYDKHITRGMILALFGMLFNEMEFSDSEISSYGTLQQMIKYCEDNYKTDISIEKMSKDLCISKSCISHTFSNKIKIPFRDYINILRLNDILPLLENSDRSITEVAIESGFETIRTFNRVFKKQYGITPAAYRKGNR